MTDLVSLVVAFTLVIMMIASVLLSLLTLTIVRRGRRSYPPASGLHTPTIRQHLDLLPNNAHLVDWYQSRDMTLDSRRLNPNIPELIPGPVWVPLRPHETLLYADELGDRVQKEINLSTPSHPNVSSRAG